MKKKIVTMTVRVLVPVGTSAAQARKEVHMLINEQCTYALDYDEIRAVSVKPESRS